MRSFQQNLDKLSARGVRVVAISVDSPKVTRKLAGEQGYTYTFLCDPQAEVIRRWDLLDLRAGADAPPMARPAEYLIDSTGVIRWLNHFEDRRARAEQVLKILDELAQTSAVKP